MIWLVVISILWWLYTLAARDVHQPCLLGHTDSPAVLEARHSPPSVTTPRPLLLTLDSPTPEPAPMLGIDQVIQRLVKHWAGYPGVPQPRRQTAPTAAASAYDQMPIWALCATAAVLAAATGAPRVHPQRRLPSAVSTPLLMSRGTAHGVSWAAATRWLMAVLAADAPTRTREWAACITSIHRRTGAAMQPATRPASAADSLALAGPELPALSWAAAVLQLCTHSSVHLQFVPRYEQAQLHRAMLALRDGGLARLPELEAAVQRAAPWPAICELWTSSPRDNWPEFCSAFERMVVRARLELPEVLQSARAAVAAHGRHSRGTALALYYSLTGSVPRQSATRVLAELSARADVVLEDTLRALKACPYDAVTFVQLVRPTADRASQRVLERSSSTSSTSGHPAPRSSTPVDACFVLVWSPRVSTKRLYMLAASPTHSITGLWVHPTLHAIRHALNRMYAVSHKPTHKGHSWSSHRTMLKYACGSTTHVFDRPDGPALAEHHSPSLGQHTHGVDPASSRGAPATLPYQSCALMQVQRSEHMGELDETSCACRACQASARLDDVQAGRLAHSHSASSESIGSMEYQCDSPLSSQAAPTSAPAKTRRYHPSMRRIAQGLRSVRQPQRQARRLSINTRWVTLASQAGSVHPLGGIHHNAGLSRLGLDATAAVMAAYMLAPAAT